MTQEADESSIRECEYVALLQRRLVAFSGTGM